MQKFISQLDLDISNQAEEHTTEDSEEKASLLYLVDTYSKYLLDIDTHPLRKTRDSFDEIVRELVKPDPANYERSLQRLRQFFSSYRIDEFSYIQKTFDDFKNIIWDFIDQLSEDLHIDETEKNVQSSFEQLKEAVESDSIDEVKKFSRSFIDNYVEFQYKQNQRKTERLKSIKENLDSVTEKLAEANQSMRLDHLTKAYNRKSFDEHIKNQSKLFNITQTPVTLIMLDIDHFKNINDSYGHQIGDLVLIECVNLLNEFFNKEKDFVARVGGEEFAIILSDQNSKQAAFMVDKLQEQIRKETYLIENEKVRFTISAGIAQILKGENVDAWIKRADECLYYAKNHGRDQYKVSDENAIAA